MQCYVCFNGGKSMELCGSTAAWKSNYQPQTRLKDLSTIGCNATSMAGQAIVSCDCLSY